MRKLIIYLLIGAILLSEIMLKFNAKAGFIYYFILMTGVVLALANSDSLDNSGKLLLSFMIFPMIRVVGLLIQLPDYWKTFAGYYVFLFLVLFYSKSLKINIGYKWENLVLFPLMILLGAVVGFLGSGLIGVEKSFAFLAILPAAALSEEIFFRGMIQNLIKKEHGVFYSVIITSLFYAFASISFGWLAAVMFFFVSLVSCIVYNSTRNILLAVILNFTIGIFMFVI